jgi:hypothetical protein
MFYSILFLSLYSVCDAETDLKDIHPYAQEADLKYIH